LTPEQVADLDQRMTAKIEKLRRAREEADLQEGDLEGADSAAATRGGRRVAKKILAR
jgi:hypothetical protein